MLKALFSRLIAEEPAAAQPAALEPAPQPAPGPAPEARSPAMQYADRLEALANEAHAAHQVFDYVNALTLMLAVIAAKNQNTAWAAADIMRRYGDHLCHLQDLESAKAEAEAAKKAGAIH
jgi:hypothetical protein